MSMERGYGRHGQDQRTPIAVFYDCQNVDAACVHAVHAHFAHTSADAASNKRTGGNNRNGIVSQHAYADWSCPFVQKWRRVNHTYGIVPVQCDAIKGKNSCDIKMAVDVISMSQSLLPYIKTFVLVSSDYDFRYVAEKLVSMGKTVIGMGYRNVSNPRIGAYYSEYIYLDSKTKEKGHAHWRPKVPRERENIRITIVDDDNYDNDHDNDHDNDRDNDHDNDRDDGIDVDLTIEVDTETPSNQTDSDEVATSVSRHAGVADIVVKREETEANIVLEDQDEGSGGVPCREKGEHVDDVHEPSHTGVIVLDDDDDAMHNTRRMTRREHLGKHVLPDGFERPPRTEKDAQNEVSRFSTKCEVKIEGHRRAPRKHRQAQAATPAATEGPRKRIRAHDKDAVL